MEIRAGGEGLLGLAPGKALVPHHNADREAVLPQEAVVGDLVDDVAGKDLGADGLLALYAVGEQDRDVPGPLDPGLPGELRKGVGAACVALEHAVNGYVLVPGDGGAAAPHETGYPGVVLPKGLQEIGDAVPAHRQVREQLACPALPVLLLHLVIRDVLAADLQEGHRVDPSRFLGVVEDAQVLEKAPGEAVNQERRRKVLDLNDLPGKLADTRDKDVVDDMADGLAVHRKIPAVLPAAADPLDHGIALAA